MDEWIEGWNGGWVDEDRQNCQMDQWCHHGTISEDDRQTDRYTIYVLDIHIYRWLVKKGKTQKAYSVLKKVRHGVSESDIREEIADIEFTVQDSKSSSIVEIFRDLFRWRIFER